MYIWIWIYVMNHAPLLAQEMNEGKETCRFLQLWISPDAKGHTPQYGSTIYRKEDR